jgi:hypothetical protein
MRSVLSWPIDRHFLARGVLKSATSRAAALTLVENAVDAVLECSLSGQPISQESLIEEVCLDDWI